MYTTELKHFNEWIVMKHFQVVSYSLKCFKNGSV